MRTTYAICALTIAIAVGVGLFGDGPIARSQGGAQTSAATDTADHCTEPANAIVAENCRPGNASTEWDINGNGDPSIQGFTTDVSYNLGDLAQFKVKSDSSRYRVDIYRMGYYQGLGARLVASLRPSASLPQAQPECVVDWSVRLYDCGNWSVSASWRIPVDAVSGVYVARLIREDPGPENWRADNARPLGPRPEAVPHAYGALGFGRLRNPLAEPRASHVIFVVRDDDNRSDVVMQTSDPSWTAYNSYGLGNTYGGRTVTGATNGRPGRANKVSFNRPINNRPGVNQYFNAEYPLTRWLERNGFDVSYIAGVDTDRQGQLLGNHRLFISIGHDEYWSAAQRTNVEAARDSGVNLAFMSGNEVFWKTRYEPSIDGTDTAYRTLVVYKESHSNQTDLGEVQPPRKIDPVSDVWTGTWRDGSAANPEGPQPENALTGTIFTVNANRQDPLAVPEKYGKLRFWRNTEVAMLTSGEVAVLGNGILGHEWDEDLDNGFRPPGLIRLSETTLDGVSYPMDWGTVYDAGTATHHLTLYRANSGAIVFGCGCVQYAYALDDFHDNPGALRAGTANPYSTRVGRDPYGTVTALQQATVNLFADMGIHPTTLQGGLVAGVASQDDRAPVSEVDPQGEGLTVAADEVTVSGTASDAGGGVVAGIEVSVDGGQRWHPAIGTEQWTYTWEPADRQGTMTIMSRATDDSLNTESPSRGVTIPYADLAVVR